jgi:hypothetical protein
MSTLSANNLSDFATGDTVETKYIVHGSAKAWINFNGTGTVLIRNGLNVSSLLDRGTGEYTITISNSFASTDYMITGNPLILNPPSVFSNQPWFWQENGNISRTSSAVPVWTNQSAATFDTSVACINFLGDLA